MIEIKAPKDVYLLLTTGTCLAFSDPVECIIEAGKLKTGFGFIIIRVNFDLTSSVLLRGKVSL